MIYFATNGDDWLYCLAKENSECGSSRFPGRERFISNISKCDWAGVECSCEFIFSIQLGKRWLSVLAILVIGLIYIKVDANISGSIFISINQLATNLKVNLLLKKFLMDVDCSISIIQICQEIIYQGHCLNNSLARSLTML